MSEHLHPEHVPGCYRCDLSADELPVPVDPDEHCPDCGRLLSCVGSCHHCEDRRSR